MASRDIDRTSGRAFISYVRADRERVDRLQDRMAASGIRVWRDTTDLWPGQDWKLEIRRAITADSLAFIACFSENTDRRNRSYQNEELILAVDELRRRSIGGSWLIPVRFAECNIPDFDLGAGRTLNSLQCVNLFGDSWEPAISRLITAVHRLLSSREPGEIPLKPSQTLPVEKPQSGTELAYQEVIRRDPANAAPRLGLGDALRGQGRDAEAEAAYREAIRLGKHPTDNDTYTEIIARSHFGLGMIMLRQERFQDAEAVLKEAIRLASDQPIFYSTLGRVLHHQERYWEAEAADRESVRLDPSFVPGYINLGDDLLRQNRIHEAAAAYREAIRLDPADDDARRRLVAIQDFRQD